MTDRWTAFGLLACACGLAAAIGGDDWPRAAIFAAGALLIAALSFIRDRGANDV